MTDCSLGLIGVLGFRVFVLIGAALGKNMTDLLPIHHPYGSHLIPFAELNKIDMSVRPLQAAFFLPS